MKTIENILVARTELRIALDRLDAFLSNAEFASPEDACLKNAVKLRFAISDSLEAISNAEFNEALDHFFYLRPAGRG